MTLHPQAKGRPAAWLALCAALTFASEGERLTAYYDVGGTITICDGETQGVKPGDTATHAECQAALMRRLQQFADGVDKCTAIVMPAKRKAAMVDFAYNEGTARYCKYIAPSINMEQPKKACDLLMHFDTAKGIVYPGLVTRRRTERDLCMDGLF